ncbi:hypothetical protein BHU72_01375 [Desulfuribacillus stibiiarsenatis]|uniref:ABC transporter ATP-binding protein n=1 Tax=Desulfuribacillus stibiiarsenatis TaxID=1390249 RepID=A0A1E5LA32_9FIRM|nr:ABC transporter ATP-binding protein [Desulfuribacillus stibiiarsenatis]OEH86938.1 hypothetical protein BHU72_01375 [Desulfuribacillus stibiiarsenatis]
MKYTLSEETGVGKSYDSKLMMRLLRYVKPYRHLFALTVVLVMLITATQLARPYMIKVAIDDHINGLHIPMITSQAGEFSIGNEVLTRDKRLRELSSVNEIPLDLQIQLAQVRQIVVYEDAHFLIDGMIANPSSPSKVTIREDGGYIFEGQPGRELLAEEMQQFRNYDIQALTKIALLFLGIIVTGFAMGYLQFYLLQYIGQRVVFDIREQAFTHLQKMSISYFDNNPVGRLVTRITNDTENLNELYTSVLVNLFKDLLMIFGIMGVLLYMDYRLALVAFATVPLMLFITFFYRLKARAVFREIRIQLAKINSNIQESLSGIKVIQAFALQKRKYEEFYQINTAHFKANFQDLILFALFRPSMDFVYALTLALLVWYGGSSVVQGTIQFGVLYAFIHYTEQFFRPIRDLAEKYNVMQSAMVSSERVFQLLDEPEQIPDSTTALVHEQPIAGRIEFKDVCFSYNQKDYVLKNISFTVNPGETVAIVGSTGSGKTTILHLLARFYEASRGSITIDDIDIKELPKAHLRSLLGIVQQDVFLFTGDIQSNIHLNHPDITNEKVREISRYVNADAFIQQLPRGYEEPVTERGSTLSTGQRQLLAFARTLAHEPKILLLDEATANIDSYTEELIQDALPKISHGRTTIIVAHRLSTIQKADRILVIHKGRLVEEGTHEELLGKKNFYYTLYKLQYH